MGFNLPYLVVIVVACGSGLAFASSTPCPPAELLHPCVCLEYEDSKDVVCDGLQHDESIVRPVRVLAGTDGLFALAVENAVLNVLPHDLFEGLDLVQLEFRGSSLMSFSDGDLAFVGLEDSLQILIVEDCSFMNQWNWALLRNLRRLRRLEISGGDLEVIGEDVREIGGLNLLHLSFVGNQISYVYDGAFASFHQLESLSLAMNSIKEVKRSMLPNPALKLEQLNIGHNEIRSVPEDMFTNMPQLQYLFIGDNQILTLPEATYFPVWEQLEHFSSDGNLLRCDCRISWILKLKKPSYFSAVCDQPKNLKGRKLNHVQHWELYC